MEPLRQRDWFLSVSDWDNIEGLVAGFTLRNNQLNLGLHVGDVIEQVLENRQFVAAQLGFPLPTWISCEQTHQDKIVKVGKGEAGLGSTKYQESLAATDGIYTAEKGILLTMCYADCVPIYFIHQKSRHIGLVHAGWRGTAMGIAAKMLATWRDVEQIDLDEIEVVIGPAICPKCYLVDGRVINQMNQMLGTKAGEVYKERESGQFLLDLKRTNELVLQGVRRISTTSYCTCCDDTLFFSYRREAGRAGRMMAFMGWKEA